MSNKVLVLLLIILKETGPTVACSSSCPSVCDCSVKGLTSVPQDLPTNITELNLYINDIRTIHQSDFLRYRGLVDLKIGFDSRMVTIDERAFHNLSNLNDLSITRTQPTTFPAGIFRGLTNLWSLNLALTSFSHLQADFFQGLGNLTDLHLGGNKLTSLPDDIFVGLGKLESLSLGKNQLTHLQADIFADLSNLKYLYLYDNQLTSIPENIFEGLSNLRALYIDQNQLTDLQEDLFVGLDNLSVLELNENQLTSLPADIFKGLDHLRRLFLNGNRLTSLADDLFKGLGNLRELYLHDNQLISLLADISMGLDNFQDTKPQGNKLNIAVDIFANLPLLEILNISFNQINHFPVELIHNINRSKLYSLSMQNNKIETLPYQAYDILASVYTVDTDYYFQINVADIGNNPWQCDCRMLPFRSRMTGRYPFENQIRCAGPINLQGQYLKNVSFADLICEQTTVASNSTLGASTKTVQSGFTISVEPTSSPIPDTTFGTDTVNTPPFSDQSEISTLMMTKSSPGPQTTHNVDSTSGMPTVTTFSSFDQPGKPSSQTTDTTPDVHFTTDFSPFVQSGKPTFRTLAYSTVSPGTIAGPTSGAFSLPTFLAAFLSVVGGLLVICAVLYTIQHIHRMKTSPSPVPEPSTVVHST